MPNISSKPAILACIDGSDVTESVCDYAAWYSDKLNLPISLLHVIEVPKSKHHDLSGAIGMSGHKHLMQELAQLDEQKARIANKHGEVLIKKAKSYIQQSISNPDTPIQLHLRHSKLLPAVEFLQTSTRVVILGRRNSDHQNGRINVGSKIETILRAVERPIMVCSEPFQSPNSYLMAFDGSATAKKAVDIICENDVAKTLKGHLVLVGHQDSECENALYRAHKQMKDAGLDVTAHAIDSKGSGHKGVVAALTDFRDQHNISLFIIGAYGHSKWRRFFVGSTSSKLLANTTAPVILIK